MGAVATAVASDDFMDSVVVGKSKLKLKGEDGSVAFDPVVTVLVYSVLLEVPVESHQTMYWSYKALKSVLHSGREGSELCRVS